MALKEIERKFLVTSDDFKKQAYKQTQITQGFLNTDPARTVRIRIRGGQGFITIKGQGSASGMSRFEWEKRIEVEEAKALLELCLPGVVEKIRFEISVGEYVFEVDEFQKENEGLIMAEVELEDEADSFKKPDWLGREVTGDIRYYNSYLSQHPFQNW